MEALVPQMPSGKRLHNGKSSFSMKQLTKNLSQMRTGSTEHLPTPDHPCMVYLPTKLGHLWGFYVGIHIPAPWMIWVQNWIIKKRINIY